MWRYFLYTFTVFFVCISPVAVFAFGLEKTEKFPLKLGIISTVIGVSYIFLSIIYWLFPIRNVYVGIFAFATFLIFCIFQILFKGKFLNKLFLFISSLYVIVVIVGIKEALYCFLSPIEAVRPYIEKNSVSENVIQYVIVAAVDALLFLILRKRRGLLKGLEIERWTLIIYVLSWLALLFLSLNFLRETRTVYYGFLHLTQSCIALMVIYFQYFVVYYEKKKNELKDSRRELELIEYEQDKAYKRYEHEMENYEFIATKCHDLKKQINLIKAVNENQTSEAIKNIEKSLSVYETSAKTGNRALDVLISEKATLCQKNGIDFAIIINGESFDFLGVIDLYAIFGNALDNAVEYLVKVDEKRRYLREEWGFEGIVITDYMTLEKGVLEAAVAAGLDLNLVTTPNLLDSSFLSHSGVVSQLYESAHRVLFVQANSLLTGVKGGGFPIYVILLILLDVFVLGYLGLVSYFLMKYEFLNKNGEKATLTKVDKTLAIVFGAIFCACIIALLIWFFVEALPALKQAFMM